MRPVCIGAIALQWHTRYVEARDNAKMRGGDLRDHGPLSTTQAECRSRYARALEDCLFETPDSAEAVLALVHFSGTLAADRLIGEVTRNPSTMSGTPNHRAVALAAVAGWLNNRVVGEYIDREREARGEDAELFASTAEWRRLEARANERGITDDERARCCDDMRVVRDKIADARPTTLRGVLAALEMASEVNDSDYWPDGAIGLREIVKP